MTDIERITDMEQCFDRVDRALRALEEAVDTITSVVDDILKLVLRTLGQVPVPN